MNSIFFDLLDKGVEIYLDDVLIYSRDVASHRVLLDQVFALLAKHKLFLKDSECHLYLERVPFLGHVVDASGVSVEQGKVDSVKSWPVPQNVNQVQQFLGLCNYYRKFVLRFSEIAGPLTLLTRKGQPWQWGADQQRAFDALKRCLCSAPTLKIFDSALQTRVVCDASNFCVGAVLE